MDQQILGTVVAHACGSHTVAPVSGSRYSLPRGVVRSVGMAAMSADRFRRGRRSCARRVAETASRIERSKRCWMRLFMGSPRSMNG